MVSDHVSLTFSYKNTSPRNSRGCPCEDAAEARAGQLRDNLDKIEKKKEDEQKKIDGYCIFGRIGRRQQVSWKTWSPVRPPCSIFKKGRLFILAPLIETELTLLPLAGPVRKTNP